MNAPQQNPADELPLSPTVFYILLALADGERHGYGIIQEVLETTNGQVHMAPGTLYGAVKRLLAKGLIEESAQRPDPQLDDERRRYYRLTAFGLRVLRAETVRLDGMVRQAQARKLLPGDASRLQAGGG